MYKIFAFLLILSWPVFIFGGQFPLCIYSVNDIKYLKTIKKAGFNCVQTYNQQPDFLKQFAKAAKKLKLDIVIMPNLIEDTPMAQEAQNWPVKAWYIYDEPDVDKLPPAKLKEIDVNTKNNFPNAKTAFVLSKGSDAKNYYDIADILMVDWYPVPHLPLNSFGQQIKDAKDILNKGGYPQKPLWGVIQSFDWRQFKQYYPDDKRIGRFPTTAEMRFMAYHGLLEGMDGIFFFTFNYYKVPLPQANAEYWRRVVKVSKELKKILPVFEEGTIAPNPIITHNNLLIQTRLYKENYYYFILNLSSQEAPLPAVFKQKQYKALFNGKTDAISPYGVFILKRGKK